MYIGQSLQRRRGGAQLRSHHHQLPLRIGHRQRNQQIVIQTRIDRPQIAHPRVGNRRHVRGDLHIGIGGPLHHLLIDPTGEIEQILADRAQILAQRRRGHHHPIRASQQPRLHRIQQPPFLLIGVIGSDAIVAIEDHRTGIEKRLIRQIEGVIRPHQRPPEPQ